LAQTALVSLITGNKVKTHNPRYCKKEKYKAKKKNFEKFNLL